MGLNVCLPFISESSWPKRPRPKSESYTFGMAISPKMQELGTVFLLEDLIVCCSPLFAAPPVLLFTATPWGNDLLWRLTGTVS
jgi:hypothetical protein